MNKIGGIKMPRKKHMEYVMDILDFCEKYNVKSYYLLCNWCQDHKKIWSNTIFNDSMKEKIILNYFAEHDPALQNEDLEIELIPYIN